MEETVSLNEDYNIRVSGEKTYEIKKFNAYYFAELYQNRGYLVGFNTICSYYIGTYLVLDAINDAFMEGHSIFSSLLFIQENVITETNVS